MDLANVTRIFVNTPVVNGVKLATGSNPIGIALPDKVEGSLTITHSINEGSEIRLSFSCVPSFRIAQLRTEFKEGSLHNYDNNQYIVTNYGETTDTRALGSYGLITTYTVEVVLLVYSYLKAQLSVRLEYPTNGTPFLSAHNIATKAGLVYNGFDFQIPVTKDSADTFFNFSLKEEVDKRAFEYQQFVCYGNNRVYTQPLQYTQPVTGVLSPVQISGSPPIQYKNAVITWANNTLSPFRNDPDYMKPTPQVVYLVEGDFAVTEPPDNIDAFRDQKGAFIASVGLSDPVSPKTTPLDDQTGTWYQATLALHLVFDNGGQTKEVRITKKVDGVTEYVESYTYGFMFTAFKFAQNGGSPADYWLPIEYKKSVYNYEKVDRSFNYIKYQDRAGIWRTTIVSPELRALLQASNVGYLTSATTTGYKYLRFQTERQGGWNIEKDTSIAGSIFWGKRVESSTLFGTGEYTTESERRYCEDMLQLYLYRKVPIYGKTQYYLVESESVYNDTYINTNKEINANIEKVAWASLPENLRNTTTPDSEGFVGIARPDPDSYKEYLAISEKTEEIALAWRRNPLAKLYNPSIQTVGERTPSVSANSLPTTYLPSLEPYVIGENRIQTVERKVIPNRNTTSNHNNILQENDKYKLPLALTFGTDFGTYINNIGNSKLTDRIDRYVEYTTTNSSRGINFDEQAAITTFAEYEGRPPLATVQRTQALQSDIQDDPFYKKDKEYYYTALLDSDLPTDDSTASFSMLEIKQSDIEGTRKALDFRLQLENASNTHELTVDLGYYRPEYKVGYLTSISEYDGQWLIRKVEHGFDFSGAFLTNKPTRLTLGYWYFVQSQITTSDFTKQSPISLPYNPSKYNVVGGRYPLDFNKPSTIPSITGARGDEQGSLAFIYF